MILRSHRIVGLSGASPSLASPANTKPLDLSMSAVRWRMLSRSSTASGWNDSSPKSSMTWRQSGTFAEKGLRGCKGSAAGRAGAHSDADETLAERAGDTQQSHRS
jgi:hypothetical protein